MKYRLVATDLDGTLLNQSGNVSVQNWKAIEEMKKRGVHFVPASGRCFMELPAQIRESEWIRYYILSGGAVIYDKATDHFEMTCPEKKLKDRALDVIFQYPICLLAHTGRDSCVDVLQHEASAYESYNMNSYWVEYALEKEKPVENFKDYVYRLEQIPMMVIFFRNMDDLNTCKALLEREKDLLVVQSDPCNLEVVSKKAGKGNALLSLAETLGIDRSSTVAVGDSLNDRTMLEEAGLSLAMENALPEMKEIADKVICDNDSHCAAYILEHYCSESEV